MERPQVREGGAATAGAISRTERKGNRSAHRRRTSSATRLATVRTSASNIPRTSYVWPLTGRSPVPLNAVSTTPGGTATPAWRSADNAAFLSATSPPTDNHNYQNNIGANPPLTLYVRGRPSFFVFPLSNGETSIFTGMYSFSPTHSGLRLLTTPHAMPSRIWAKAKPPEREGHLPRRRA